MKGMKIIIILIIFMSFCSGSAETDLIRKIGEDESFMVPGLGAEKVILGEDIKLAVQRFSENRFKVSKPEKTAELFKDVFGLQSQAPIYFDAIYHDAGKKISIFIFQNRVIAVLGMNVNRVTIDFVDLSIGVNNFILSYGIKDLNQIKNESHGIYYYPAKGIAVVDDNLDGTIDMFIIFRARGHNGRREN